MLSSKRFNHIKHVDMNAYQHVKFFRRQFRDNTFRINVVFSNQTDFNYERVGDTSCVYTKPGSDDLLLTAPVYELAEIKKYATDTHMECHYFELNINGNLKPVSQFRLVLEQL